MKLIHKFARNDSGATAIEYGLIAGGISIVIIAAIAIAGPALEGVFDQIAAALAPTPS
ncbi:Flp family type IVb pilin [Roseitranquillus sediminis]|uniref:Flp family type IVb pilin n=1 Tax=Roseitranquillus sediminis TaxID=2809051 RepID=UPI001D0CA89C|nr:Flp family type IVb pilin [Roseitranquillus sediminis]MBM9594748.1 Flp family type IVb pilin [Roseitranquillus sediminis]